MKNKKKYESIFSRDEDWHLNACLSLNNEPLDSIAEGYKEAADRLINS